MLAKHFIKEAPSSLGLREETSYYDMEVPLYVSIIIIVGECGSDRICRIAYYRIGAISKP